VCFRSRLQNTPAKVLGIAPISGTSTRAQHVYSHTASNLFSLQPDVCVCLQQPVRHEAGVVACIAACRRMCRMCMRAFLQGVCWQQPARHYLEFALRIHNCAYQCPWQFDGVSLQCSFPGCPSAGYTCESAFLSNAQLAVSLRVAGVHRSMHVHHGAALLWEGFACSQRLPLGSQGRLRHAACMHMLLQVCTYACLT
jgi:hypothetical protein